MLICKNHKFIFIHIPKNSGTEMSHQLQNVYPDSTSMSLVEKNGSNRGVDKMHLYTTVISNFISTDILDT